MQNASRNRRYFGLLLLISGALPTRPATAQLQHLTKQQLERADRQCMQAKTPTQCREVLSVCQRVAAILEQRTATPDLDATTDKVVNQLANCEEKLGEYAQAEQHFRQSLHIRQRLHSPENPAIAESIHDLASTLDSQGKYGEAETLYRQAIGMLRRLLGPEHVDLALSLNDLALVLKHEGKYAEAETLCRQALGMHQRLLGAEHPNVARTLNNLASLCQYQGKLGEAETLHRQALAMRRKLLGDQHIDVAESTGNLASLLRNQGKYGEAETLYRQALGLFQRLLGAQHPTVATIINNLAGMLGRQGRDAEAETLYRQALTMRQKLLGAEHPDVATSINDLASILDEQAKYAEAETLYRQALAMRQKLLGAEHPNVATSINNLAGVLFRQAKYAPAETMYRQALAMRQKLLGAEHSDVASSIHNLAGVLDRQGKHAAAEPLYRQALGMFQQHLGFEHPNTAASLGNLATVLYSQGKYAEAEILNRQALAIRQKLLPAEHPIIGQSLYNIGLLLLAQDQFHAAIASLSQAVRIWERQLRLTVSETRVHALLADLRRQEETIYGLLLSSLADTEVQKLALTTALLRKGRAAEAGVIANRLLHGSLTDPAVSQRFSQWQELRQQREALLYGNPRAVKPDALRAQLTQLTLQAESLEGQLAAGLPEIKKLQPPDFDAILPAIAQRLPKNGALIEVVWAKPYQIHATGSQPRWAAPHYIALLLFPDQRSLSIDLGEAAAVDANTRSLLAALQSAQSDPTAAAHKLYQQLLVPLLPHLGTVSELFLSLDGTLNLVPFDALHDGHDYLLGHYRFHYLTSGRDLLREAAKRTPGPALLLANPDFGQTDASPEPAGRLSLYQRLAGLSRLPGTKREAELLAPLLRVTPLLDGKAREEAVHAARSPWILHIATHGLFISDIDLQPPSESERGLRDFSLNRAVRTKNVSTPQAELLPGEAGAMNRSALALAGVVQGDRAKTPAEDGLLTAEEARSLELDGTQLVVLSACETGQGALSAGQGVYGLRRAFLVAGAETLVTSLWRVHDEATGELMGIYYRKLLDKNKPGDRLGAMQEAMQELRARPDRSHPYYWAPFQVIGQDGPLRPVTMPASRAQ